METPSNEEIFTETEVQALMNAKTLTTQMPNVTPIEEKSTTDNVVKNATTTPTSVIDAITETPATIVDTTIFNFNLTNYALKPTTSGSFKNIRKTYTAL